jgi:hypothetical protein
MPKHRGRAGLLYCRVMSWGEIFIIGDPEDLVHVDWSKSGKVI